MKNIQRFKTSLLLVPTVLSICYFTITTIKKHSKMKPATVLSLIRKTMPHPKQIQGAWIESKSSYIKRFNRKIPVYYGGISIYESNDLMQYEFIADAHTGTIIDIYRN